jgi:phosphotransferase system enzyme I (PtsP)
VPITRGISKIGALTLHREKGGHFSEEDVTAMRVIASQLANIIENAGALLQLTPEPTSGLRRRVVPFEDQTFVQGMSASDGTVMGKAFVLDRMRSFSQLLETDFEEGYTVEAFRDALLETERQLNKLQGDIEGKLDDAASLIFTSHLLILKDQVFIDEVISKIKAGENPPAALLTVAKKYIDIFMHSKNPYIQEKVSDLEDVVLRIIGNLDQSNADRASVRKKIVVAKELYPSDILTLSSEGALGIIQVSGGITSHVAILARSLQIPMTIVDMPQLMNVSPGTLVVLDGDGGSIYVNPHPDVVGTYTDRIRTHRHIETLQPDMKPETFTRDGTRVRLMANINLFSDLKLALDLKAEGVGLYRTEFPFLIRRDFPTEAEQYVIYKRIVERSMGRQITFRTLDIGGDKIFSYFENYKETNPFLGMRSIRFSLQNREIFKQQVRAMLQACSEGTTRIMFPMISSVDQFKEAKDILFSCREELLEEGIDFREEPKVGMMVEVPALVEIMDDLAPETDFFSIGTNDLIQYILGVDRTNEKVADLYLPHHPAVLRSLKRIVDAAKHHDKEISICGAMGHQARYVPFLLGIGIRILSMNAMFLPRMQKLIYGLDIREAEQLSEEILRQGSVRKVSALLAEAEQLHISR